MISCVLVEVHVCILTTGDDGAVQSTVYKQRLLSRLLNTAQDTASISFSKVIA